MDALPCLPLIAGGRCISFSAVRSNHTVDYRKQRGNPGNRQNLLHAGVLSGCYVWVSRLFPVFQDDNSDCSNDNNNCGNNNDFQHIVQLLSSGLSVFPDYE